MQSIADVRSIVCLARVPEHAGDGRERDDEVERAEVDGALESTERVELGREDALEALLRVRGEHAVGKESALGEVPGNLFRGVVCRQIGPRILRAVG